MGPTLGCNALTTTRGQVHVNTISFHTYKTKLFSQIVSSYYSIGQIKNNDQ